MSDFEIPVTPKKDTRMLAVGLAAAAAVLLVFAAFSQAWLVNGGRYSEIGFGLNGNHTCMTSFGGLDDSGGSQECHDMSNGAFIEKWRDMGEEAAKLTSSAFVPMGKATFFIILLGALGLIAAAALGYLKKAPDWPIAPTTVALLCAMFGLITGCVFVATKPGPAGMVGVGMGFWAFGIGSVLGIVGAQMLAKQIRPPEPEWTAE